MDPGVERAERELEDVKAVREEAKAALAEAKAALAKAENKLEETDKERKQAQKNLDDYVDRFPAVCVSLDFHDYHFPSKILRAQGQEPSGHKFDSLSKEVKRLEKQRDEEAARRAQLEEDVRRLRIFLFPTSALSVPASAPQPGKRKSAQVVFLSELREMYDIFSIQSKNSIFNEIRI